jgi:hypothetical protein
LNLAVVIVVLALAAATFVLSYSGVHAIAEQAGVSARLARLYPGVFDAVFVIACVAAIALRDARWWTRAYAWLVIIVVVAVVGAADVVHAMSVALPHRTTEGVVAAAPWVLVLLGFTLMMIMLRQSRAPHADTAPALVQAADHRPAAPSPAELPESARREPTRPAYEAVLAEPAPTAEEPVLAEPAPTREQPAVSEPAPTAEEPVLAEAAPPRAEPVVAQAAAPEPDAGPQGGPADPDATRETAIATGHEPVPTWPAPTLVQSLERGPVDSGLVAPPREFWGTDGKDEPRGQDDPRPPEIDEDAPPFATAPFATVPRLNRVRATPVPPEGEEE